MLAGMAGMHGASLPMALLPKVGPILAAFGLHPAGVWEGGHDFLLLWGMIAAELLIVLACPNILEILAAHQPALGFKGPPGPRRPAASAAGRLARVGRLGSPS